MTRRLEDLGAEAVPLVLPGYPDRPKRHPWEAATAPVRVQSEDDLRALPAPHYVIHLHWHLDRTLPPEKQMDFELQENIKRLAFLWNVLQDAGCRTLLNVSSTKVFGRLDSAMPITSETEPQPCTPYGRAKYEAERYFDARFHTGSPRIVHARLCAVASAGEHPSHLMARLYQSAFEELPITVNIRHRTSLLYIDEAVDLLIQAAVQNKAQRLVVASDPVPNEEIARLFETIAGRPLHAEFTDLEPGLRELDFLSNVTALRQPWTRTTTLEKMIETIIAIRKRHERTRQNVR